MGGGEQRLTSKGRVVQLALPRANCGWPFCFRMLNRQKFEQGGLILKTSFKAAAGLLALAAPAVFATAFAAPAPVAQGQIVQIPFHPPVGKVLRFRHSKVAEGSETKGSFPASVVYSYRFDKTAEGFNLTVSPELPPGALPIPADLAGEFGDRIFELVRLPLILKLGADGEFMGLQNEKEYAAAIDKMLTSLASVVPDDAPAERKAAAQALIRAVRSMPMESWIAKFMESVQPVVEFAGTEFALGEPVQMESEVTGPNGVIIPRTVAVTLKRTDGDTAHILAVDTASPEAFSRMMRELMVQLVQAGGEEAKKELGRFKQASQERRSTYRVSTRDGMLQSYELVDTTEVVTADGTNHRVRKASIERMD